MADIREGGCLCGKVRYRIDLTGHETGNCHCRDCQLNSGAPFMTFTNVPRAQFEWLSPPTGGHKASDLAVRRFCADCGTPLQWDGVDEPEIANVSTATLDDPTGVRVAYEIFTRSRQEDVQPVPGVPQYETTSLEE